MVTAVHWTVVVEAQTFQYSRGWTNGKRSSSSAGGLTLLPWAEFSAAIKNGSIADSSSVADVTNDEVVVDDGYLLIIY